MKLLFILLLSFHSAEARKCLLMIGGGQRPPEAMTRFVQASGGPSARILVISWASKEQTGAEHIRDELNLDQPAQVELAPRLPLTPTQVSRFKNNLPRYTGIFFSGGNQNLLMETILNLKLKTTFKNLYDSGVVFGGTSAGTAVMSERMITGDDSPLAEGLGLLPPEIIVDQHFLVRQRMERLAHHVIHLPGTVGIGIDEGTSLWVMNDRIARVLGPSSVIVISMDRDQTLNVEIHPSNHLFNLFKMKDFF